MEEELQPLLVEYKDLSKDHLLNVITDLQHVVENQRTQLESFQDTISTNFKQYNEDTAYLQEMQSNVVKYYKQKEEAFKQIIEAAIKLQSLDSFTIAPQRKEN